jgi:hypothetical protein
MKITEYFHETGQTIKRDATADELSNWVITPTLEEDLQAKATNKAALLERLGITADEATLLLS